MDLEKSGNYRCMKPPPRKCQTCGGRVEGPSTLALTLRKGGFTAGKNKGKGGLLRVLNTLQTSALFISSNTYDVSLLVIGRSIPKISNLVSLISLANLALCNLSERF